MLLSLLLILKFKQSNIACQYTVYVCLINKYNLCGIEGVEVRDKSERVIDLGKISHQPVQGLRSMFWSGGLKGEYVSVS